MFKFAAQQSRFYGGTGSLCLLSWVIFIFLLFCYSDKIHLKLDLKSLQDLNQEKMRKRIKKVCQDMEVSNLTTKSLRDSFTVDPVHKVTFCRNGKVGTTTWMKHFSKLLSPEYKSAHPHDFDSMSNLQLHQFISGHFMYKPGYDLNQTFKFSFVRHPYDRLVSTFKDKFVGEELNVTFEYFLLDVILQHRLEDKGGKSMNVHIRPYYKRCEYCNVAYDFIGRMETFAQDVQEVLKRANLTHFIPLKDASLRSHSTKMLNESKSRGLDSNGAIKSSSYAQHYFVNVSSKIMHHIHRIYSLDFAMFHYSFDGFLRS